MGALKLVGDRAVRAPADSHIRLLVRPEAVSRLAEGQRALAEGIRSAAAHLERRTHDPSVHAALQTVAARIADVGDVSESLDDVIASLWMGSAPLKPSSTVVIYLEGVQRWALAVAEELGALASALMEMHADWSTFRFRLGLAKAEWPTELVTELECALTKLDDADLTEGVQDLSFALHVLDANLAQRFG